MSKMSFSTMLIEAIVAQISDVMFCILLSVADDEAELRYLVLVEFTSGKFSRLNTHPIIYNLLYLTILLWTKQNFYFTLYLLYLLTNSVSPLLGSPTRVSIDTEYNRFTCTNLYDVSNTVCFNQGIRPFSGVVGGWFRVS